MAQVRSGGIDMLRLLFYMYIKRKFSFFLLKENVLKFENLSCFFVGWFDTFLAR